MSTLLSSPGDRDTVQAINALKKGSYLLKYGRWGKPKFCPFQLSNDETTLIWYVGKEQKQLQLSKVSRIIPGQRTAIFQRYPQPEKEYQSFSLIYGKRSLDVICKDKSEAEIWFVALRALISQGNVQKWTTEIRADGTLSDCSSDQTERNSQSIVSNSSSDAVHEDIQNYRTSDASFERLPQKRLARAFSDVVLHKTSSLCSPQRDSIFCSGISEPNESGRNSADSRLSFSSAISTSSLESSPGDIPLCSIFMWGKGIEDGLLDGDSFPGKDTFSPKFLKSASIIDAQNMACGSGHAVLISRQGQVFSWGDGSGGKLGHGSEADISSPKLIDALVGLNIVSIGCGDYHTCAVTATGGLYTWGDGIHNSGLLGHGTELSYWTPRKVRGQMEGISVASISCGPWHSAAITSLGQLFTFGDGTFGALGHGDRFSTSFPREVEALKGQKTVRVSCGFWHTAAIVEGNSDLPSCSDAFVGNLFTWGNGDDGKLGLGDKLCRLVPCSVATPNDRSFCQVACGHTITVALTICGQVYTMGGHGNSSRTLPINIEGKLKDCFVKEISCGSHHIAVVTSKSEVFTWGKGKYGQLGHGDNADKNSPTLVTALEGKQVKRVICGTNFTAAICTHKWICAADYSICAGCRSQFNFKRRRHNCYNCGLVFCKACTSKKSLRASLAPNLNKLHRVCEDCFSKLNKGLDSRLNSRPPKSNSLCLRVDPGKEKKKEPSKATSHSALSRLSSFDSFRRSNTQLSKKNQKLLLSSTPSSPFREGNFGCDRSSQSSPSASIFDSCEQSFKMHPTSSLVSTKLTPHFREEVNDDSKQTNEDLAEEISFLREQVELLTRKSQMLAGELAKTSDQLNEATAIVQDEYEKNSSAKEAIKRLMSQLKEMASKVPQGPSCRTFGPCADMYHVLSTAST
ncbi:hypothetical protein ABFS82_09G037700 [Erythranthe guttata]|nr:PREDICTED: uncharacterized protein LOC105959776 isoform X1 [Erythranthe guttata]XP_012839378.1 PREDICTED: uncharacterized protein LOC105959776 isoform X1 [Erythranthe guttata]|eukprot:XP_012839376.1 PREDICTED: uncharacterized protein LOC105959776 isoform X1 [Erythranthe guttata]